MTQDEQERHDSYITKAEAAITLLGAAAYYEAAAILSGDTSEWELAAAKYRQAGKKEEALFCERQANYYNGG